MHSSKNRYDCIRVTVSRKKALCMCHFCVLFTVMHHRTFFFLLIFQLRLLLFLRLQLFLLVFVDFGRLALRQQSRGGLMKRFDDCHSLFVDCFRRIKRDSFVCGFIFAGFLFHLPRWTSISLYFPLKTSTVTFTTLRAMDFWYNCTDDLF